MTVMNTWASRAVWLVLGLAGCEGEEPAEVEAVSPPAVVEKKSPLAKDDPRFKPYVPKPKDPLDFSGVDVGDEPMADAAESLDALGNAIVDALNEGDREALAKLAVTEREYKDRFFPVTIHHKSGLGLGAELAWAELHGESKGDMNTALERYGEGDLTFVRFDTKDVAHRPKVNLHRRPKVVVTDASGREQTLVMLGSILEHTPTGGFKVLAFRDTP